MSSDKKLRCVVVTPEKVFLEREVSLVVIPSFDGEVGILPGHVPTVARLGSGEMRLSEERSGKSYYVEGGFAQIRDNVVTILTPVVRELTELDTAKLERELEELSLTLESSFSAGGQQHRLEKMNRIRSALRLAKKTH